jgi:hypothetical protein
VATWTFADGSELETGGLVRGKGEAARLLRMDLFENGPPVVQVGPIPMKPIPLDVRSNYMLDLLARDVAACSHQKVRSDYEPSDEDVPEAVRVVQEQADRGILGSVF